MNTSNSNKRLHYLTRILTICVLLSCKKFVAIGPAPNLLETKNVFSSDQAATSAVVGLYAQMRTVNLSLLNGGISLYTGLSSDEIVNTSSTTTADPFVLNALTPQNATIGSFWTAAYTGIYQANSIIEGLSNSQSLMDSVKTQLLGEMKFARAFYYFHLVNLFGDVPLVTTTDYRINQSMPRTATTSVYQQLLSDLKEAQNNLKATYPTANKARPNKWVVTAFLSRVQLYLRNWAEAETEATAVINSGLYSMGTALNNVFLIGSNETIFQLASDNANTADGAVFIPSSSTVRPTYAFTGFLSASFETGDLRKIAWTSTTTVGGVNYIYPLKYKARTNTPLIEFEIVARLSEQYMIRAEARAQQGKILEAKSDLNVVRSRAGLANTLADDQSALLLAIEQERKVELFCEWGHRWFDLKRTTRANTILTVVKGSNWQNTDALYPIPQSQLELNPFLTQNPGY